MTWVAFVPPNPDAECQVCFDYGGLYDDETWDHEGQPFSTSCLDCPKWKNMEGYRDRD